MNRLPSIILTLFILILLAACETNLITNTTQITGWAPIYVTPDSIENIKVLPAKTTQKAGKIYTLGNYIFQDDELLGIHIIDITNPAQPLKRSFIQVPFSTEVAVKGNFLYTNNLNDLVVFNISDPRTPTMVKRVRNVFPRVNQKYPPEQNTFFDCPDPAKGLVIGWERKILSNPKCQR